MATIYYKPTACNCDGTDYIKVDIEVAAAKALQLAKARKTVGDEKYPRAYNGCEHFNFAHAEAPYLEFPVLQDGIIYEGGKPGADRVVIGSISEDFSSAVYCACVTHFGEEGDGFAACKDNSMNPRGRGTLPLGMEERKLVGRIDL